MKPTVYIETTIPSFYHSMRSTPEMIAVGQWTRDWWDGESFRYQLVTSRAVLKELEQGEHRNKSEKLAMLRNIPLLAINTPVAEIVEIYIQRKIMPANATGDALHLALASFYNCDYLLTWNCKHIANANKINHIRRVNQLLHLKTPELVTPLELTSEVL
jgi:predicted nucleic acid-binding protein